MPELPEVETVRRVLKESILNKTIQSVEIRWDNIITNPKDEFKNNVIHKTIIDIKRYGKYLIFELNQGYILSHLRMEGKYYYITNTPLDNKHIHVIFAFSDGTKLAYQDVRKFGKMTYIEKDIYNVPPLSQLGPDLYLEEEFDILSIYKNIHKRNLPIKAILLDQGVVAGLGNIYVDEVLFHAKINPKKKGIYITKSSVLTILEESKRILSLAIAYKGTTIRSYTSSLGVTGSFQDFLEVHTKNVCPNCKTPLKRVKIEGRMTYYCNKCQR